MKSNRTEKKLTGSIITVIVLLICLAMTTFAIITATVEVNNNIFRTGLVDINLNDGKPIIEQHEFLFEPGMTVKKDFFVESKSSGEVYYRLYLGEVSGGLADILEVTVATLENNTVGAPADKVLYHGIASEMILANAAAADDTLAVGERRNLCMIFHFPEAAGNTAMEQTLSFNMYAEAVQTKNNELKEFR